MPAGDERTERGTEHTKTDERMHAMEHAAQHTRIRARL
jgi:hypothetical protein